MPIPLVPRCAPARCAAAAALLLALAGCSSGGGTDGGASPSVLVTSPAGTAGASLSTQQETCERVIETLRSAPERLLQDPLALLQDVTVLAETAPAELSGQLTAVRDAVDEFRRGERPLSSVVGQIRELQERCSS